MRATRNWALFRGLPEAAVHRITARTTKTEGKVLLGRSAALRMPLCDPGNPSHYLRLEEEKEIRIVVSDNSCFGAVPRGQICMEPRLYGNYHDGESLNISEN